MPGGFLTMNITDLAETAVNFEIECTSGISKYWDYTFYARVNGDYEYMQSMNRSDIEQLRNNCMKIILATQSMS
jgi:hypothetical protein